jgi:hypothetical protein
MSISRVSALPSAAFRFHLGMDILAVRLIVSFVESIVDFHREFTRPPHMHQTSTKPAPVKALRAMPGGPKKGGHWPPKLFIMNT